MASDRQNEIVAVLRRRLLSALHLGRLRAGARLAGVRDVATEFGVHQRVALAAYRDLERDGLVTLRERSGVYVRGANAEEAMLPRLTDRLVAFLMDALSMGVPAPDVPERVRRCLETVRLRAVCLECNADQIDSLCTQLSRDFGFDAEGVELDDLATETRGSVLQRADLLVTTSFHADVVRRAAERLGKRWIAVSLRADIIAEITRELATGPVYFLVSDPRFAEKLRMMVAGVPSGANIRPLLVGVDDLDTIPADAPIHIMTRALRQLEGHPLLARIAPVERSLSLESSRELLGFVVRANMAAMSGMTTMTAMNVR